MLAAWHHLDEVSIVQIKLVLALVAAAVLAWGWLARVRPAWRRGRRVRDGLLIAVAMLSGAAWCNFGRFHFDRYVHYYEFYHYYLGAKYAPELGYTRLYACTVIAADEVGPPGELGTLRIRELSDNSYTTGAEVLAHPERCKSHFTPERWQTFVADVDYFRHASPWPAWTAALGDHGYNATPVWRVVPGLLANTGPLDDGQLFWLSLVDPVLLLLTFACIWWAFGWRASCVALVFFGTNFPADYLWTGGAFFRMDWLLATIASICLLKRGRPAAAGAAIAIATLLRVFPGILVLGLLLKMIVTSVRARRLTVTPEQRRFVIGGLCATAAALAIAGAYGGGLGSWRAFAVNSQKHLSAPVINNMGWKPAVSYVQPHPAHVVSLSSGGDPSAEWIREHEQSFHHRIVLFAGGVVGFLVLFALAAVRHDDWVALVLGAGLVLVTADLTCYYYVLFLILALLDAELPWAGGALLLASAAGCAIPLYVSHWVDEQYVAISMIDLVLVAMIATALARARRVNPA